MTGPVIAIVPSGTAIGVCLVGVDVVLEAVTISATPTRSRAPIEDLAAAVALAVQAVLAAQQMVGEAFARGDLVFSPQWVVLGTGVPALTTQNKRAAAGIAHIVRARLATSIATGAVLATLTAAGIDALVIDAADVSATPTDEVPKDLAGRVPTGWVKRAPLRHGGRVNREPQRTAWAVCVAAPDTVTPEAEVPVVPAVVPAVAPKVVRPVCTDSAWRTVIRDAVKAGVGAKPLHQQVLAAAITALAAHPAPASLAGINAAEVATDAVVGGGVAPDLWGFTPTLLTKFTHTLTQMKDDR